MPIRSGIFVSTANSTTTPLGVGGTFTGTAESMLLFAGTTINIAGSASGVAPGTLYFEYSLDGTLWDVSVPIAISDINAGMIPLPLRTVLPYFRVRYVNGGVAVTAIRLTVVHHYTAPETLTRLLSQALTNAEPIKTVQAVTAAEYINALGTYDNLLMTSRRTLLAEPPALATWQCSRINVGTGATRLDNTPLANRVTAEVLYPLSTAHTQGGSVDGLVYVGFNNGVTTASASRELQPGESWRFDASAAVTIFAVSNFAAQPVTLTEGAP